MTAGSFREDCMWLLALISGVGGCIETGSDDAHSGHDPHSEPSPEEKELPNDQLRQVHNDVSGAWPVQCLGTAAPLTVERATAAFLRMKNVGFACTFQHRSVRLSGVTSKGPCILGTYQATTVPLTSVFSLSAKCCSTMRSSCQQHSTQTCM